MKIVDITKCYSLLQMILSFELPFALIPLLKFTSSKTKMGPYANSLPVYQQFVFSLISIKDNTDDCVIKHFISVAAGSNNCLAAWLIYHGS